MGKGTIISHTGDGQYQVSVQYNVERVQAEKAANLAKIANLTDRISEETDEQKRNVLKLQKLSLEKRNEVLDTIQESREITAWCADLTEDLSGDVGLIEVPGESVAFNIQPGYEGNAAYNAARDGQLTPTLAMTPAAAFYNLAMLPSWQKWKPTYRYGTITAISGDTADVSLHVATSTQQGLSVNQESTLTGVPVEYMSCNGGVFEVGDEVLVKFTGQDWGSPAVVGFKDEPKACSCAYVFIKNDAEDGTPDQFWYVVWDVLNNTFADITWKHGGTEYHFDTWPINDQIIETWWSEEKAKYSEFTTWLSPFQAWSYYLENGFNDAHVDPDDDYYVIRFRDGMTGDPVGSALVLFKETPEDILIDNDNEYKSILRKIVRSGPLLGDKIYGGAEYNVIWEDGVEVYASLTGQYANSMSVIDPMAKFRSNVTPHFVSYFTYAHTENWWYPGGVKPDWDEEIHQANDWDIKFHISPLHSFNENPKTDLGILPEDVIEVPQITSLLLIRGADKDVGEVPDIFYYNLTVDAFSYMGDEPTV